MTSKEFTVRIVSAITLVFLAILFHCSSVEAADRSEEFTLSFEKNYSITEYRGFDFIRWTGRDCTMYSPVGYPLMPMKHVRVAVPQGFEYSGLETGQVKSERLKGDFRIYPSQPSVPLGLPVRVRFDEGNPEIYGSMSKYPRAPVEFAGELTMGGYKIVSLKVHPLQYVPGSGELSFNSSISFEVLFNEIPDTAPRLKPVSSPKREAIVKSLVINADDVESPVTEPLEEDTVQYLIITGGAFLNEFQVLADWYTRTGVPAEVISNWYVYDNYPGEDNQKKIKNCILDYYQNKGLVYVLLGCDVIRIPDRDCYVEIQIGSDVYTSWNMPSDIYYSALSDGNWDDDGDGQYGEYFDDTVDWTPNVYVGRVSVNTEAEATDYINKILVYTKTPPAENFAKKFLLSGKALYSLYWGDNIPPGYDHSPVSDMEYKCDIIYNNHIAPYWSPALHKFYDTFTSFDSVEAGDYELNAEHLTEKISDGYGFMYMATHGGNTKWQMEGSDNWFYSADAFSCTNSPKPTVMYTIACSTNSFDREYDDPCLSEAFTRSFNGGAVAYMGCSRFGWAKTDKTLGPSMLFGAEFFEKFLNENRYILGEAFALHKASFIWEASHGPDAPNSLTWLMYGINLMGDPAMPLWTDDPSEFDPQYRRTILTGPQTLTVNTGVDGVRVCLWKDTEVYVYGTAGASGEYIPSINPVTNGTMKLTITAQNYRPYEADITVINYDDDIDLDGMADGFELIIIDDDYDDDIETVEDVLGSDDYDDDGRSNMNEYLDGTDPTDPEASLQIVDIERFTTGPDTFDVVIEWDSIDGKSYSVYFSDDIFGPAMTWEPAEENIAASGAGTNTWTDNGDYRTGNIHPYDVDHRFYRVEIYTGQ